MIIMEYIRHSRAVEMRQSVMKEKIRLIALDLDGTLLNSEKKITEETRKTLLRAAEEGIYICIASGRRYEDVERLSQELLPGQPVICANGAAAYLSEPYECVYCETLEQKELRGVIGVLEKEKVFYQVYVDDGSVMLSTRKSVYSYANYNGFKLSGDEMPKYVGDGALKVIAITDDAPLLERVRAGVEKLDYVEINSSWSNNIEVLRKGVNKGSALRALAQRLEIPMEEIMAFGDNGNDIAMFEAAGWPVCMENGTDEAKAAARYVTDSNDRDGVAKAVKKIVFGEED